jgi:serine/threonine protein kinase
LAKQAERERVAEMEVTERAEESKNKESHDDDPIPVDLIRSSQLLGPFPAALIKPKFIDNVEDTSRAPVAKGFVPDGHGNADDSINDREECESFYTQESICLALDGYDRTTSRRPSDALSHAGIDLGLGGLLYHGNIKLIKKIGEGAEGDLWLVDIEENREIRRAVLKEFKLHHHQQDEEHLLERLLTEYKILEMLNHVNIMRYTMLYHGHRRGALIPEQNKFGVLMDYMSGGSLDEYIKVNYERLTDADKKNFIRQILEGLNYLHLHNVIHRDLKLGNILLDSSQKAIKITDFGLAKVVEDSISMKRSFVGTPYYMAPEIIQSAPYSKKVLSFP